MQPGVKGLSPTNLKYMKYFYELYSDISNRQQVADDFKEDAVLLPKTLWKVLLCQSEFLSMSFQNFIRLILRAACLRLKKLRNLYCQSDCHCEERSDVAIYFLSISSKLKSIVCAPPANST